MINVPNPQLLGQICLDNFIYDPIVNPIDTFSTFFNYQDLQQHLKKLKQWKAFVITYDYLEINTFSNPLYHHKMMCNLVNAAWLLIQDPFPTSLLKDLSSKEQEIFLNRECLNFECYVKHLSTSELIDPYIGIKLCYEQFTLQETHQQLYEWLNTILSPNVMIEDSEMIGAFYKNLRKLIECCWLILNRHAEMGEVAENMFLSDDIEESKVALDEENISPKVLAGFKQFLTIVPAQRLNKGLRKMLIDYLFYNINGLPTDFEETLTDFYWLTDFLDEIQGKAIDPKFM